MNFDYPYLDELVDFHGHLCPGLAIGYRATMAGLIHLGVGRARDEELIAIVENNSCSVDAVQFLAGATFGKGNFFFRDWGKQVFTFARRDRDTAIRVALRWRSLETGPDDNASGTGQDPDENRRKRTEAILSAAENEIFDITEVRLELPPLARILRSVRCENCGEPVMETRTAMIDGRELCKDCARNLEAGTDKG